MGDKNIIVFDFDSTFVKVESLDLLAEIKASSNTDFSEIKEKISEITHLAMQGKMSFSEALTERVKLLEGTKEDLILLVKELKSLVSDSILRNKSFIKNNADSIYIVSGGFKEFIVPIVKEFGIVENHVFANTFTFDFDGKIIGVDPKNALASDRGKVAVFQELAFKDKVYLLGDGYTDYEVREALYCDCFVAFGENIERPEVIKKADMVVKSFEEFLSEINVNVPKENKLKVLLLENIHPKAKELFVANGFEVEIKAGAMSESELLEVIPEVHIVGLRSKTVLTKKVIASANNLLAIGAFCIGTNQIDLRMAEERGIAVFNAPYSNSRSVVELAIANIIMLMRNLGSSLVKIHEGVWSKSSQNSFEVRNKVLGIVGYGNIGEQLSVLAESLGMKVIYYDLENKRSLGNAKAVYSMRELLMQSDAVSLHVDGRLENENLIAMRELKLMKKQAVLVNLSRGNVVNLTDLSIALKSEHIKGAAIDVFPEEPKDNQSKFSSSLAHLPNTILTSHIGGSTNEAQENIAELVPEKLSSFIKTGNTSTNLTLPEIQHKPIERAHHFIHIHENIPGMLASVNEVLAKYKINILAQTHKTKNTIGYMITSVDKDYKPEVTDALSNLTHTLRFRVLD